MLCLLDRFHATRRPCVSVGEPWEPLRFEDIHCDPNDLAEPVATGDAEREAVFVAETGLTLEPP